MLELTTEQREIQEWARQFAARYIAPVALELDANPESPAREELIREASKAGLLGNVLPEFLGGQELDPMMGALITEELAAACAGCTVLMGATMLGITPILASGDLGAMERWIKPLADSWTTDSPKMAALAATEPGMGSDFIQGHAEGKASTRYERKDGGYVINGRKIFISNGSLADMVTVFASRDTRAPIRDSISCFVVPADTPGFAVGQVFDKMGQRACPATELLFGKSVV